jgi:ribonuclease BN (tRNA processing enzyme)
MTTRAGLLVLGCDGGYPGPGGAGSGYLVRMGGATLCLDMGPGVLAGLQSELPLSGVDAVVISHEHPDHRADLDALAVALHFSDPPIAIPVLAPAGVREHMYFQDWEELRWMTVADGERVEFKGCELRFSRTDHGPETLAVRLAAPGATLVYSADTGPGWSPDPRWKGCDLMLCEATWTKEQEGRSQHLSGRQAGLMARALGARELLLTHRWPTLEAGPVLEEAAETFQAEVQVAARKDVFHWGGR